MMQAMELLQLAKRTSSDEATLYSEESKSVAIAIIELCLSECISKESVSQLVKILKILKVCSKFLE